MRTIKKTIAVILCILIAASSLAFAEGVKDYNGHWAQKTIEKWMTEGKISGYPDGSYKPDNNVTRAEFVKMVNGIIDFNKKANLTFKDVPATEWYYEYISVAQNIGYISGYSTEKFGPNDYITREQAASILSRIQYLDNNASGLDKFSDKTSISSWAAGLVGSSSEAGFISGYEDGSFRPLKNLTRAEALTMIDNVMVNGKNLVVYNDNTKLNDTKINGDLIIAKTVGEGNVYLTNLDIAGTVKVYGGGMNSVYFNNVKIAKIIVEKDKVRLVFDEGSKVEDLVISSQVELVNKDGSIAKVTVTGDKAVTLSGKYDDVTIVGKSNIILKDAKITKLTVEQPIVIQGTGTIAALQANANGIKYESAVKIDKTTLGTGITEKPAIISSGGGGGGGTPGPDPQPKTYKFSFDLTVNADEEYYIPFTPVKAYSETDKVSDIVEDFIPEIKTLVNTNKVKIEEMLELYNKRIENVETIKVGNTVIYTKADGYNDNAYKYLDNTDMKEYLDDNYPNLLDKVNVEIEDITKLLDVYKNVYGNPETVKNDLEIIKGALEGKFAATPDSKITFVDSKLAEKSFSMDFDSKVDYMDVDTVSELVDFINQNYKYSYLTLADFVEKYGNKIEITTDAGNYKATFTVELKLQ